MYRPSGYNRIFCVVVSTELRCFEMPSLPVDDVACCAWARIPDEALGKIIAARKHRALAGCKCKGRFVFVRQYIFRLSLSFFTNEQYEPRNARVIILLCVYVCPYIYLLKFLMNHLFSCCFEITITPGG